MAANFGSASTRHPFLFLTRTQARPLELVELKSWKKNCKSTSCRVPSATPAVCFRAWHRHSRDRGLDKSRCMAAFFKLETDLQPLHDRAVEEDRYVGRTQSEHDFGIVRLAGVSLSKFSKVVKTHLHMKKRSLLGLGGV